MGSQKVHYHRCTWSGMRSQRIHYHRRCTWSEVWEAKRFIITGEPGQMYEKPKDSLSQRVNLVRGLGSQKIHYHRCTWSGMRSQKIHYHRCTWSEVWEAKRYIITGVPGQRYEKPKDTLSQVYLVRGMRSQKIHYHRCTWSEVWEAKRFIFTEGEPSKRFGKPKNSLLQKVNLVRGMRGQMIHYHRWTLWDNSSKF